MPFSAIGSGAIGITPLNPQLFIDNYVKSKKIAKQYDIHLSMAGTQIDKINTYFCGAIGSNCIVTPEGQISTCSRVTKGNDPLASVFMIGEVNKSGFLVDEKKASELIHLNLYSFNYCQPCFAKYVCSGGCPHDRLSFGNAMPEYWCEIVRNIVWYEIRDLAIEQ
ncbi:MAG: SPASM domain-containing protein [Anaerolineales bacterium]|nr:SPASM domain-containing protein [Anaerolineales bacterium]